MICMLGVRTTLAGGGGIGITIPSSTILDLAVAAEGFFHAPAPAPAVRPNVHAVRPFM